jgi:hypothetical protein
MGVSTLGHCHPNATALNKNSLRHYVAMANKSRVVSSMEQALGKINSYNFKVESIEPRYADTSLRSLID